MLGPRKLHERRLYRYNAITSQPDSAGLGLEGWYSSATIRKIKESDRMGWVCSMHRKLKK